MDEWMSKDVETFRGALGVNTRIVLVTPNWICDSKLYSSYRRQMLVAPPSARWRACTDWVRTHSSGVTAGFEALDLCEKYTFTSTGTLAMSRRIADAAKRLRCRLLDATALTQDRCNVTEDARHYPAIVPLQAERLVRELS